MVEVSEGPKLRVFSAQPACTKSFAGSSLTMSLSLMSSFRKLEL